MKSINNLLITGLLFLLSSITFGQIEQYSDDGSKSCIDCNSIFLGPTDVPRECFCRFIFDFTQFNANIPTDHRREEWFREREHALKFEMESVLGKTYQNFHDLQMDFFRSYQANHFAQEYYPRILEKLKTESNFNNITYSTSRVNADVLIARKKQIERVQAGLPKTQFFGALKYKNQLIENITSLPQITSYINEHNAQYDTQLSNLRIWKPLLQKYEHAVNDQFVENFLALQFIHDYNALDYEDAIKTMVKYMVSYHQSNYSILNHNFGSQGFDLRNQDYTDRLIRHIKQLQIGLDPVTPYQPSIDDALFSYALRSFGSDESSFMREADKTHLRATTKLYLEHHNYSNGALGWSNNAIRKYLNGELSHNSFDNYVVNGSGTWQNLPVDLGVDLAYKWTFNNLGEVNGLTGLSGFFNALFNLDANHYTLEGSYIKKMLEANKLNIGDLPNEDLGKLLNFSAVYPFGEHQFDIFFEYSIPIKNVLNAHNISFQDLLKNHNLVSLIGEMIDAVNQGNLSNQDILNLLDFAGRYNSTDDVINFSKELIRALNSTNTIDKEIATGILNAINNNTVFDFSPYINPNAETINTGATGLCPDPPCNPAPDFETLWTYGGGLLQGVSDAFYSSLLRSFEWWVTDKREGKWIRDVLIHKGVDFYGDIDNETLGEMFIVRYEGSQLVIRWDGGLGADLIDLGFNVLDIATIISPSKGGGAYLAVNGGAPITKAALKAHLARLKQIGKTTLSGGRGYKSFEAFKRVEGRASPGNNLHHIVEQNGYKKLNEQKFGKTNIHNTKNILDIPSGSGSLHSKVTGHYNSKPAFANGKTVREWLADKSFEFQYNYGIQKLLDFGWDGVSGIFN
ncbi:hypothetical protein ACFSTE_05940 [Aquimarina hainanensis]|uniref:Uncharacterized protein n=1 Tax=Aquimarina hainanensis TaxID=1578017 RepID=A0ABW5N4B7_9FLAO